MKEHGYIYEKFGIFPKVQYKQAVIRALIDKVPMPMNIPKSHTILERIIRNFDLDSIKYALSYRQFPPMGIRYGLTQSDIYYKIFS